MKNFNDATHFAVLGLGRFGISLVRALSEYNVNILACDENEARLHEADEYATRTVLADMADEEALERLGLGNFDVVVISLGGDFEAAVIATMKLKELGAPRVVVKANSERQKHIFDRVGADLVVMPEMEVGIRLANHMMRHNILDALQESDYLDVTEMHPMDEWVGKTIREADIRKKNGINLLAVVRDRKTVLPVRPDEVMQKDDILVVLCGIDGMGT